MLPALVQGGRLAMQFLPAIMGVGAALPSLKQGNFGQAALQGGLGYLTGMPLKGLVGTASRAVSAQAPRLAGAILPNLVDAPGFNVVAKQLARAGIGLGGGLLALKGGELMGQPAVAQGVQQGIQQGGGAVVQGGAGLLGYQAPGAADYSGAALPPNLGMYGGVTPYGLPTDVLGPAGMGQRLQTLKDAETMRDAMRLLLPEEYKAAEARSKSEMARQLAAAGIRQNIQTRAAMQQAAQVAGLNAGMNALNTAGQAVTRQYQYQ